MSSKFRQFIVPIVLLFIKFAQTSTDIFVVKAEWLSQIENWNSLVRSGHGDRVAFEMAQAAHQRIPHHHIGAFANLAWRVGRPVLGLRVTAPEIKLNVVLAHATDPEILTEHAACLIEIGAIAEAKRALESVAGLHKRAKFVLALLYFKAWNYQAAVPLLEDYIKEIPHDYHRLVARVNLASAYVATTDWQKAENLLDEVIDEAKAGERWLLLGNCHEIQSQIYFFDRDYKRALEILEESERLLSASKNMGWLYCQKWQILNRAFMQGRVTEEAKKLRALAEQMKSWETMRELDLFVSLCAKDEEGISRVYYGSPLMYYRERIINQAKIYFPSFELPEAYVRGPKNKAKNLGDLLLEDEDNLRAFLPKKLLLSLAMEAYSPMRTGQVFSELFGEDYFDPTTSPEKVFQIVKRLRVWLGQKGFSGSIQNTDAGYKLKLKTQGLVLERTVIETQVSGRADFYRMKVIDLFGNREFSAKELAEKMGWSARSSNRLIKQLTSDKQILQIGSGRSTRFKIAS